MKATPSRGGRTNRAGRPDPSDDAVPETPEGTPFLTTPTGAEPRWSLWGDAEL